MFHPRFHILPSVVMLSNQDLVHSNQNPPDGFRIYVKTLTDTTFPILVVHRETIWDVKNKIEHKTGLPAADQRLIFAGTQLEDAQTIEEYNISKESTIHVIIRLDDWNTGGGVQGNREASSHLCLIL